MDRETERRRKENEDIVARMRRGEDLMRYASQDTWWQPRPLVKKDAAAIRSIFGKGTDGN